MIRTLAAALLAAAAAAPTSASASAYPVGQTAKVIVAKHSALNVRARPGFHGHVVGSIPAWGAPFVHACRPGHGGEWCKVTYRGCTGWVSARFLRFW